MNWESKRIINPVIMCFWRTKKNNALRVFSVKTFNEFYFIVEIS